jgi:hypothetical protein
MAMLNNQRVNTMLIPHGWIVIAHVSSRPSHLIPRNYSGVGRATASGPRDEQVGRRRLHRQKSRHEIRYPLVISHSHGIDGPFLDGLPVYVLKMVIFHGYVKSPDGKIIRWITCCHLKKHWDFTRGRLEFRTGMCRALSGISLYNMRWTRPCRS